MAGTAGSSSYTPPNDVPCCNNESQPLTSPPEPPRFSAQSCYSAGSTPNSQGHYQSSPKLCPSPRNIILKTCLPPLDRIAHSKEPRKEEEEEEAVDSFSTNETASSTLYWTRKDQVNAAMAPAVTIDNSSDFNPVPSITKMNGFQARTLLLAPPSIASHEEKLHSVLSTHDRAFTDLQMLDRLAASLVTLPASTYDLVMILTDANGTRNESSQLLTRTVFSKVVDALKAGGKFQSQDGSFGQNPRSTEYTEAILAGLVANGTEGMVKPDYISSAAVPLRFGKKKDNTSSVSNAGPIVSTAAVPLNAKRKSVDITQNSKPAGVGFVDFSDDFQDPEDDDDELIDEDTLLTEEDLKKPIVVRKLPFPMLHHFGLPLT